MILIIAQLLELNRELHDLLPASMPPILSVDQEGGRVLRVRDTAWPPMRWLGNADDAGLTRAVALEVATRNIRVNAVCPGFTRTPMTEAALDADGRALHI